MPDPPRSVKPALSSREIEVLVAWLRVDSKAEAAADLFISGATIKTHITRIRRKYDEVGRPARTKSALLVRAIQDGLVTLSDWD